MSFLDILILVILAGSLLYGFKKGLIKQIGSVAAIVLGIIAARILGGAIGALFGLILPVSFVETEAGQFAISIMGRVSVFVLIYCVVLFLAKSLKFLAHLLLMGPIDRALGAVMAMVQWFLAFSVILNIYAAFNPDTLLTNHSQLAGGLALEAIISFAPMLLGSAYAPWLG